MCEHSRGKANVVAVDDALGDKLNLVTVLSSFCRRLEVLFNKSGYVVTARAMKVLSYGFKGVLRSLHVAGDLAYEFGKGSWACAVRKSQLAELLCIVLHDSVQNHRIKGLHVGDELRRKGLVVAVVLKVDILIGQIHGNVLALVATEYYRRKCRHRPGIASDVFKEL